MSQRPGTLNTFCMRYRANMEISSERSFTSRLHSPIMILIKSAVSPRFRRSYTEVMTFLWLSLKCDSSGNDAAETMQMLMLQFR